MLFEALLQTFHGKYFYFGFKLSGTSHSQAATLKDVLTYTSDESQTSSQFENNFEKSHTLVYQILPTAASSLVTVTDRMRQAVSALKHGNTLANSLSHRKDIRHMSMVSEHGLSRSDSISSCRNSYVENSKQESVAFSFEESDTSSSSFTNSQNRSRFTKQNPSNITCRSSKTQRTRNDCTSVLNMNGTFIKNVHAKEQSQSVNMTADLTTTLANEIVRQLDYNTTGELGICNTSSRIDHELRIREIKRKVENFSRCILLSQRNEKESKREHFSKGSVKTKSQNVSLSAVSNTASIPEFEEQISRKSENEKDSNGCLRQSLLYCDNPNFPSTGHRSSKTSDMNSDLDDSHSLTAFLESQTDTFENGANSFKAKQTDLQSNAKVKSINEKVQDRYCGGINEPLKTNQIHNETEDKKGKDNISQISEVVREELPYSEGLDTFFGTQFTDELLEHFEEEEEEKGEENVEQIESSKKSNISNGLEMPLQNETCLSNGMQAGDFIDLPESEGLEAFLSTFDDGIKDSGLCSDNTATSLEQNDENAKDFKNKEKMSARYSQGNKRSVTVHNTEKPSHNSEELNTKSVFKSENLSNRSANETTDSELDSFLANITDEIKVSEEMRTSEINRESLNKSNIDNDCSIDLDDYLDGINTSNIDVQNFEAIKLNPVVIEIPANEKDNDYNCEKTSLNQIITEEKNIIMSEIEMCPDLNRAEKCSVEELNDIKTDTINDKESPPPLTNYMDENILAKRNTESVSIRLDNSLHWHDDSFEDVLHENSQSLYSDLDNALISVQNVTLNDCGTSVITYSSRGIELESCKDNSVIPSLTVSGSSHVGTNSETIENEIEIIPMASVVNSSIDLFDDSYCSPNIKLQAVLHADQNVIVGDSDTEKNRDASSESDDSIIMDSPNSFVDEKKTRGDSLASLFRNRLCLPAVEKEETVKNVKFHRQLRRVSSCQLMDIKMKLNTSPHRKGKGRRKSILKVKPDEKLKQRSPISDHVSNGVNNVSLDILEEKSHLFMSRNTEKEDNDKNVSISGSQDLFSDNEEIIKSSISPTEIINNILDDYIDKRKLVENLQDTSVIHVNGDALGSGTGTGNNVSIAELSGSQDLFSQDPSVNQNYSKQLCMGESATFNVLGILENDLNHKVTVTKGLKHSSCDVLEDEKNSNHFVRKQAFLRDVLLDVTNTPNDFHRNTNKPLVEENKQPKSKSGYQIIADTPDLSACQKENKPVYPKCCSNEWPVNKAKTLDAKNVSNTKEILKMTAAVTMSRSQNSSVIVEDSPDLFADSPGAPANTVSLPSKSNVKLFPTLLCKKLFS